MRMPDSSEKCNQSLFSQSCEVGNGKFEPHIKAAEALLVRHSCANPFREKIVSCKSPAYEKFIQEIDGLALDKSLSTIEISLPSYIPIVDGRVNKLSQFAIPSPVIGVTLRNVIKGGAKFKAGTWHEVKEISFNLSFLLNNAIRGKKAILLSSGQDALIENLWYEREDVGLFEHLAAMGFVAMTGINFSIIKGECPLGQAINHKKGLYSAYLAEQAGLASIPHVYSVNEFDLKRWIDYLIKNPQIRIISMNCQLQKSTADIDTVVTAVTTILGNVPSDLHIILTGFELPQIYRFGRFLSRIHFADKAAIKSAQSHKIFRVDIEKVQIYEEFSQSDMNTLTPHNINQRQMYIELVKQKILEGYKIPEDIELLLRLQITSNHSS